jgi:nucleotide-binding universal stress UspA family protein
MEPSRKQQAVNPAFSFPTAGLPYLAMLPMHRVALSVGLAACLLPVGSPTLAQEDSCRHRTLEVNFDVRKGSPISMLSVEDMEGQVGGKAVKLVSLVPDERPHRVVILLDASGSVRDAWKQSLGYAASFVDLETPNTQMTLMIFADKVRETISFEQGQVAVRNRVHELGARMGAADQYVRGTTALYDALLASVDLFGNPTSADSLYLISDGRENHSEADLKRVTRRLAAAGIRFFATLIYNSEAARATVEEGSGPPEMIELAAKTGGEVIAFPVSPPSATDRNPLRPAWIMEAFRRHIIQSGRLEVELPERLQRPHRWTLRLAGQRKMVQSDVRILYPLELAACGP